MLSIENKVNGNLISVLTLTREQEIDPEINSYELRYFRLSEPVYHFSTRIFHKHSEGQEELVKIAYTEVSKKMKPILKRYEKKTGNP